MGGLILNPNDIEDGAGRNLNHAMAEFMTAFVQRFPALAPATARGFQIRLILSDGTQWQANGGAAPMPAVPGASPNGRR